jgi:phage protein U
MFLQIGNFIFDKAYTPDGLSHTDETNYAEHALINLKPRLQPTGNNLEEFNFTIKLRAEIVNITQTLLALKKSKDSFEVLPFLYGYGAYMGDYIITKIDHTIIFTLDDGTPVEIDVSIALKEYVVPDKLQQQQNAARKAAFAVGNKQPSVLPPIPKYNPAQLASKDLSSAYSHAAVMDTNIRNFQNNISSRQSLADKIKADIANMSKSLDTAKTHIQDVSAQYENLTDAIAVINNRIDTVKGSLQNFSFPISSPGDLADNNTAMQAAVKNLKTGSFELTNLVITRKG